MSGVLRVDENITQYHVQVTTRSGQNKPRLIEVDTSTNSFTLSNFSNGKATIARQFDLRNLTKFERLDQEVFLRLYFISPAVSCDLSFTDFESLLYFLDIVKEYNPDVIDEVILDEEEAQNSDQTGDSSPNLNTSPQQQQQQQSGTVPGSGGSSLQQDLSADVTQTQQQAGQAASQTKQVDQKKLVNKWRELLAKHGPGTHTGYKAYVRQGIPPSVRAEAWISLSDLQAMKQSAGLGYYRSLITLALNEQYNEVNRAIDQGLNLNDPKNIKNENLHRVCRILRAYNVRNVNVGYSQQLVFICALLISVLEEEDSFWMMCFFVEKICSVDISAGSSNSTLQNSTKNSNERSMSNLEKEDKDIQHNHLFYYHHSNQLGLKIDQASFGSLLQDKLPKIASKLQQLSIPIPPLTSRWFTAILIHTLRADIVLRVWDCVLFDGVKALFRAYLTIFKWNEKAILKCSNRGEFIAALQDFASSPIDTNQFISTMYGMWLRSFSVSDIVHYRRLHAKLLISDEQLAESESSRILTSNLDSQLKSSTIVDKQQQEQQQQAIVNAAKIEAEKKRAEEDEKAKIASERARLASEEAERTRIAAEHEKDQVERIQKQKRAEKAEKDRIEAQNAKDLQDKAAAAAAVKAESDQVPQPPPADNQDEQIVVVHPIPSQTQSAPVSRVILRGTHNRLFATIASQNRPPAINIYGAKRAFSPPLPDCYGPGEPMSDYTDEDNDEHQVDPRDLEKHSLPLVVPGQTPKPQVITVTTTSAGITTTTADAPPPPPPQDDDVLPPPPPQDDSGDQPPPPPQDGGSVGGSPQIALALPPPVNLDDNNSFSLPPKNDSEDQDTITPIVTVIEDPLLTQAAPTASRVSSFRRPGQAPTPQPLTRKESGFGGDDDAPPGSDGFIAKKQLHDEKMLEKAKQMALESIQKQNIKDVMAKMTLPQQDTADDELVQPVPDSSDDEAEAADDAGGVELPPNMAADTDDEDDDDDDDGIVDPFGKKSKPITPEPQVQAQNNNDEDDDEEDGIVNPFGKKTPVVATTTTDSASKAFRRPVLNTKNDIQPDSTGNQLPQPEESSDQPQQSLPMPPSGGEDDLYQEPTQPLPTPEPEPVQVPPENKAKAIIQRSLLLKKHATARPKDLARAHQQHQQQMHPTETPSQSLPPPPDFDLPTPPPEEGQPLQQQQTQEALFWPTEPVHQPQMDTSQSPTHRQNQYIDPLASITSAVGPMIDPARRCVHCHQQIYQNALYANNQLWHPECFQCKTCHVSLAGTPYYTNNGNIYCQDHYAISKGYVCIYCNGVVTEGMALGSSDYAHFDCIACSTCHSRPSQYELQRLANGQSTIANQSTFHLNRQPQFQNSNKSQYYQFLCHTHFMAQRSPTAMTPRAGGGFFHPPAGAAVSPSPSPSHNQQASQQPYVDPNAPVCHRCDLPLQGATTKVQGNTYHQSCLGCAVCNTYIAQCLTKPQGVLFSEKKKGIFFCCDHTNIPAETCTKCQEPLSLEQSVPQHQSHRLHTYCGSAPVQVSPRQIQPVPVQRPLVTPPATPVPTPPPTPTAPKCSMCGISDPKEPAVAIRAKPIHKKCLECCTCHTIMGTDILKTFPAMMYPAVYRNFTTRQPDYSQQDSYYASHTMSPTNQHPEMPVGLICSYCHEAYVKNQ